MSNKVFLVLACTLAISLSGCFAGMLLRPIQGPTPKFDPLMDPRGAFNSGRFYVDLDNTEKPFLHEECRGRWEPAFSPKANGKGSAPGADDLAAAWNIAFGAGFYEKSVLTAKQCARGSGTSKKGTVLEAEMCELAVESNGKMKWIRRVVAKDNHNNVYATWDGLRIAHSSM